MEDLSLHILDLVENSTAAGATLVEISIKADVKNDLLMIRIKDNGRGMAPEMAARAKDPFVTSRTTRRVGLGLPLLEQSAREAEGQFELHSIPGEGTTVQATFRNSHIDRKPLGDIASTMIALFLGNPEVDFVFERDSDGIRAKVDTREIRAQLGEIPITHPAVLEQLRPLLNGSGEEEPPADPKGGS